MSVTTFPRPTRRWLPALGPATLALAAPGGREAAPPPPGRGRRPGGRRFSPSCLALALLVGPAAAQAQETGSIAGQVRPLPGRELVLATARIPDLGLQSAVARDGSFRFEGVRPGSYLIEVRVPSLGVVAERVEVRPGEETVAEIVLVAGSHSEEIVVTASSIARDPFELATPTTSLSGQDLALRQESSLGETLAQEPGVSSTFFGPGASRPIIRGLTGDRVRTLEGGIDTGDASGVSADHAVTADPSLAERIEVLRGPSTLLYGSSAIGGVINVIDERIPSVRATAGIAGSLALRGGTVNDERQGSLDLGGGGGDWAWHVSGVAREADDYEVPGFAVLEEEGEHEEEEAAFGVVPNTDFETRAGQVGATYFFGDQGFLGVSASGFASDYGLPGGLEHAEHEEEDEVPVRIDMEQRRFDLKGQVNQPFAGFDALRIRVGATDYEHVELEGSEPGTLFFNDFVETRIELVQAQRGRHSGSLGAQYLDRDLEAVGAEAFLPRTTTERWALFTLQELAAGPLRWQLGGRFESQDQVPAVSGSRSHDGLSASLGLVWDASESVAVAASAARSVKMPAAEELFSNGPHVANQIFEVGDADLDEEVGLGLDLSLRLDTEPVSGELTVFRQEFDGFIFQALTGAEMDGFPVVLYRQQDATFKGAEVRARVELFDRDDRHVHLSLVGDTVEAELDAGDSLPRIPPMRVGGGLHYHSDRLSGSIEAQWVDDQADVAQVESPTDGYTLVGASLGYRFFLSDQVVDLLLRGRNLTDEEARSHTSFLKDVAPLPGRNVTLGITLQF